MPQRRFTDACGFDWDVWDVRPQDMLRRNTYDRRSADRSDLPLSEPRVAHDLADGWLCFQSGRERRRFAPIPPHWEELPDGLLRLMVEVADPADAAADHSEHRG